MTFSSFGAQFLILCLVCCVSLYIFRRSSKGGKEISKKKLKRSTRTCKSCGKISTCSSRGCTQKEFLGDPDCDDEPVVTKISSRRRMSSALSTTSSGGASVCSGCSEASMDNDMSKSQIRSWLNEEEPHGAMVDWMKSDMMRRGVALSDARSQRSDTALCGSGERQERLETKMPPPSRPRFRVYVSDAC